MKIKTLATAIIIPIITAIILNIIMSVKFTTKTDCNNIANKYFTAVIEKDLNGMLKYSTDIRYDNIEDRKLELVDLINHADQLIEYKLVEDENPNDNKITAILKYDSGEVTENHLEVKSGKVEIGHNLEDVGRILSNTKSNNTDYNN